VQRVLGGSPEPFAVTNREKRGALSHFQPYGVPVFHGQLRANRRRVNEEMLDSHRPVHRLAEAITAKVLDEARPLVLTACRGRWAGTSSPSPGGVRCAGWCSGDAARNDHEITDLLARLRATVWAATAAYWAPLQIPWGARSRSVVMLRVRIRG
jgi:hypothetical protein